MCTNYIFPFFDHTRRVHLIGESLHLHGNHIPISNIPPNCNCDEKLFLSLLPVGEVSKVAAVAVVVTVVNLVKLPEVLPAKILQKPSLHPAKNEGDH